MPELPEEQSKLDIATMIANNWAKTGANVALSPLHMIKELMSHDYKIGGHDYAGANKAAEVGLMTMGMGGLMPKPAGAIGMSGGRPPTWFTPEKINQLKALHEEYAGTKSANKAIIKDFRAAKWR